MIDVRFLVSSEYPRERELLFFSREEQLAGHPEEWTADFADLPFVGFEMAGHADSAPHGEDLVCAAATALSMTTVASAVELLQVRADIETDEGYLRFVCENLSELSARQREDLDLLLQAFFLGLRQINDSYDNQYLSLRTEVLLGFGGQKNDED